MIKIVKELIKNNVKVQEIEAYDTKTKEREKYYLAFEYDGKFWRRLGSFWYEYNTLESALEKAIEKIGRMDRDEKLIKQIRNELKKRGITKTEERESFATDYIALSKLTAKLTAGSINKIIAMCSYPDSYEDVSEDTQDLTEDNGEIREQKKEGEDMVTPRGTDKAELINVIKTTSILGDGTKEDPVRLIYQYWDLKGKLLAFHDTLNDNEIISSQ